MSTYTCIYNRVDNFCACDKTKLTIEIPIFIFFFFKSMKFAKICLETRKEKVKRHLHCQTELQGAFQRYLLSLNELLFPTLV